MVALLAAAACLPAAAQTAVRPLAAGTVRADRLAADEIHIFSAELSAGDLLELVVDQDGVDVVTELRGPEGAILLTADRVIGAHGAEPLVFVAGESGLHRIEVRAAAGGPGGGPAGGYELTVVALRPASADDRLRARAARLVFAGTGAAAAGDVAAARAALAEAAELWRRAGDPAWQGEVADRLCRLARSRGDWTGAEEPCAQAVERFAAAGDVRRRALALRTLGVVRHRKGETEGALAALGEALELAAALEERRLSLEVLYSRGQVRQVRDEFQGAQDDYEAALEIAQELDERPLAGQVLHDLGVLRRFLGDPLTATERLEQAEVIFRELGDDTLRAASLNQLGHLAQQTGHPERALELYEQALGLRRAADDRRGVAVTLTKIAGLRHARGDGDAALAAYDEARRLLAELEEPWSEANTLVAVAALHEDAGRPAEARAAYDEVAAGYRAIGDATGEAEGLLGLARNHPPGGAGEAVVAAAAGLALLEAVRSRSLRGDLRTSFFVSVRGHYDAVVELMMELERAEPGRGWAVRALGVAERARARALLDRIVETSDAFRRGVDPALLRRARELRDELSAAETRRLRLLDLDAPEADVENAERQARRLAEDLEAARADILDASPAYHAATASRPLTGEEVGGLLGPDDQMLVYHLGEARGHLWLVDTAGVAAFELPPRAELEEAARDAHRLLLGSHSPIARAALGPLLCRLGEHLLGPAADRLRAHRLVVVPDGALHYLPFAVLPDGGAGGCPGAPPLVARHEVVHLPSASALAAVRERGRRAPPAGLVAVLADPVFGPSDPRVTAEVAGATGGAALEGLAFERLPFTRVEAEAILALSPAELSFAAFGFDADKQLVLGGRLAGYRLVHLATHGLLDETDPVLVLSRVDRQGRGRDGFLHSHELYDVELASDLVVLSGCGTALGREVRGEGLVGLARGFMTAGASSLVVSLWRVSDRATADLMADLYGGILGAGQPPAAALREAQLAAWRRGAPPAEWAAFVLQGDWRTGTEAAASHPRSVTAPASHPPNPSERSTP